MAMCNIQAIAFSVEDTIFNGSILERKRGQAPVGITTEMALKQR
jgi:hypothetical protein